MDAVVLAAGYVTRPQPHIRSTPKPLLPIAGRPVIDLLVSKLAASRHIGRIFVLTNNRYLSQFQDWERQFRARNPSLGPELEVTPDGTSSPAKRLGAVGDLDYLHRLMHFREPLLVVAGDNYFEFSIDDFIERFHENARDKSPAPSLIALANLAGTARTAGRFGVATLDTDGRLIDFREKPGETTSTLASTLCYILTPDALNRLGLYVGKHPNVHAAGRFISYLVVEQNDPVYGFTFTTPWFDVGDYDQYRTLSQMQLHRTFAADPDFSHSTEAVILFADIIGASTISEHTSQEDYDGFICEFQKIALEVVQQNLGRYQFTPEDKAFCEYSVRGDELVVILYTHDQARDLRAATSIAIGLKRQCFLSSFNRNRRGKSFYNVGIGIHVGSVVLKRHPSIRGSDRTFNAEGYSINLTKRIEGYSRNGRISKIIMSKRVRDIAPPSLKLSEPIDASLAGIYGSYALYELVAYGDIEDPESIPSVDPADVDYHVEALENGTYDLWLSLMLARYYYDEEEYATADKYYQETTEIYQSFAIGHMFLGRSRYRQYKLLEAKTALERACELDPLSSKAHHFRAVTLRRLDNYKDALENHERATKFAGADDSGSPFEFNAFAYTIAESFPAFKDKGYTLEKARVYLERAIRALGTRSEQLAYLLEHTRGLIELRAADFDKAIACFTDGIDCIMRDVEMRPRKREEKLLELHFHRGVAYAERSRTRRAGAVRDRELALEDLQASLQSKELDDRPAIAYYWFSPANTLITELEALARTPVRRRGARADGSAPKSAATVP